MSWQIDTTHSQVQFSVCHLMISTVRGCFREFGGTIQFDEDNPLNSMVEITVNAASIDTREQQRDAHLRSVDFFEVDKYPEITFKSTGVRQTAVNIGYLIGDLTIHGITKEVVFDVEYAGKRRNLRGSNSAGFTVSGSVARKDFGLVWNQLLEGGGILVGEKIDIDIDIELVDG